MHENLKKMKRYGVDVREFLIIGDVAWLSMRQSPPKDSRRSDYGLQQWTRINTITETVKDTEIQNVKLYIEHDNRPNQNLHSNQEKNRVNLQI